MSRSGYSDDYEFCHLWEQTVNRALRGKQRVTPGWPVGTLEDFAEYLVYCFTTYKTDAERAEAKSAMMKLFGSWWEESK